MHTIFFGLKRMHLLAVEFSRSLLQPLMSRLTPARFDMMRIVHVHDLEGVSVPQANIRLLLGVSAATVSRMLKALEQLGFIVRTRQWRDARCVDVRLTDRGRFEVQMAMEDRVDNGWVDNLVLDAVEPHEECLESLTEILDFLRNCFDDPAPFQNPWRCGQLDVGWPERFFSPPKWPFTASRRTE